MDGVGLILVVVWDSASPLPPYCSIRLEISYA